jgi:Ran GTPase-activating protein (RanGAP) involved in mRNA processing and transport
VDNERECLARLELDIADEVVTSLSHRALESLRCAIPAARGLPLLDCLAQSQSSSVVLDYLDSARLCLRVIR